MITNATPTTASSAAPTGAPASLPDIRDIKPPLEIPTGWEWIWWVIIPLIILVAALLIWRHLRNQKLHIPVLPPTPPHIVAKQRLQEALSLIGQPKPFVIAVSDAARSYLETRFNFHAPERTTEEFLRELKATDRLFPDQKESLGNFLESCDLVKFAKYEPGEAELLGLHGSALRLVEETEPESKPVDGETTEEAR